MRIFKFGGASVKSPDAVKNVVRVLQHEGTENTLVVSFNDDKLVIVVSAMGKMTNAFERLIKAYTESTDDVKPALEAIKDFHTEMLDGLFDKGDEVYTKVMYLFGELAGRMAINTSEDYNYIYDQIVGFGEILSTTIVSAYLTKIGVENQWLDVREYIKTDTTKLNITQGFLGNDGEYTTTLGREGSDYTAGIFAYCLQADSVTIWKDVPGVLNADPRVFSETELLRKISYTEAVEMAFYGASVIHPKTIQPLEQKQIPLYVRSFDDLDREGTTVLKTEGITPEVPCYIVKKNQILVSISAKDFSFMVEDNISDVFKKLHDCKLKVNLIQNSAISFSVCIEDKFNMFDTFYDELKSFYTIKSYRDVTLYTIRHFDDEAINSIRAKGKAIIRQINTETAQLVIQEKA